MDIIMLHRVGGSTDGGGMMALSYQTTPDNAGKCTPHTSCICPAIIRGQSAAMIRRGVGIGRPGPCSARSRVMRSFPAPSQRLQETASMGRWVVCGPG